MLTQRTQLQSSWFCAQWLAFFVITSILGAITFVILFNSCSLFRSCDLQILVNRFEKIFYDFCMFVMNSYTLVYQYFSVFVAVAAPFESSCLRGAQQKTNLTFVGPPLFHEFFSFCIHAVGMWFDFYGADKIVFLMNHLSSITIIRKKNMTSTLQF